MTQDISGFGVQVNIIGSNTFPVGFVVTQFADDADPFDIPSIQIADKAMGLNGDLIVWAKAAPIEVTINVIPGSDDDQNLSILAEANRVGRGKSSAQDIIQMTRIMPNGAALTLTGGKMTNAMPASSIASSGRQKTKTYMFAFENRVGAPG